jgi:RNA polymerase sigma-70 factor, ECF subfamily
MGIPDSRLTNVVPLRKSGELPDAVLVQAALEDEEWAREALFRRHVKRAMGLCYRLLPEEDPEDIVQEAFIKAFDRLATLAQPSSFGSWLHSVVVSLVRMRLRKRRWLNRLGLLAAEEPLEPESLLSSDVGQDVKAEATQLYGFLKCLSEEQRVALLLQRVEGLDLKEIAEQMGMSVSTVKRRVAEAHQKLEEVIGHE